MSSSASSSSSSPSRRKALFISSLIILWYSSNIGGHSSQQVPALQLWLQLPNLPHNVPHGSVLKIATLSIVFCASVVGGNISLRYLPVSFNQAVGATTPFFTAVFAYLMTLKREAWVTYVALVPVVAGVVMQVGLFDAMPSRSYIGLMGSEAEVKDPQLWDKPWLLQGYYVIPSAENKEKLNSMNLLLYMSPIAVLVLLPAALIMEPNVLDATISLGKEHKFMWMLLLVNSAMAYSANLSNFLVTKHTSPLTLQVQHLWLLFSLSVLGNAKGAVAVVISILIFQNPVTVVGISGYTITVLGVVAYGETKRRFK
ncbi:UDP-URONIC ACID TRANSPORTER 1 [Vitis vinifera]|uniref:UDP-URONIC ACID TRANSPORTER 1 n=1 Tax=Vitis vinifera TaxID=29760 RepID=A0A438C015_VITVI|nr:UDP-URONIC ACID TRANSPORTER 1 [Vitis vinifera]